VVATNSSAGAEKGSGAFAPRPAPGRHALARDMLGSKLNAKLKPNQINRIRVAPRMLGEHVACQRVAPNPCGEGGRDLMQY
jgi:hypothetical protein